MRSGKIFFVLSLVILVVLAVWGCSDTPTAPAATDFESNFQAVQTEVNDFLDTALTQITHGLQLADASTSFDTAVAVVYSPINPDSINHEVNWTVIYSSDLATAYNWYSIDSLQFTRNGQVQDSAKGCDIITLQHHFDFECSDTTGLFRNRQGYASLQFSDLSTGTATVNGVRAVTIQTRTNPNNWRRNFTMEMSFNGVQIPRANNGWQSGCPSDGSVTGTVTFTAARGSNPPTEGTWTYEVIFTDGIASGTVTDGVITRNFTKTICQ